MNLPTLCCFSAVFSNIIYCDLIAAADLAEWKAQC